MAKSVLMILHHSVGFFLRLQIFLFQTRIKKYSPANFAFSNKKSSKFSLNHFIFLNHSYQVINPLHENFRLKNSQAILFSTKDTKNSFKDLVSVYLFIQKEDDKAREPSIIFK